MTCALTPEQYQMLSQCALFSGCAREELEGALRHEDCLLHAYDTGQVVYQPRSFSRCLGVLLEGSVRVTRDTLVISTLSPGDLFGAAALFNDEPDYATTLTARSRCLVILIAQTLLSRWMDDWPQIRDNYIRYLSGRIRFLSDKIRALAADSTEARLVQHLLTNLTPQDSCLRCPATELARRLGIGRASLYRAFDSLEGRGLIRRQAQVIEVPDLDALEACVL